MVITTESKNVKARNDKPRTLSRGWGGVGLVG